MNVKQVDKKHVYCSCMNDHTQSAAKKVTDFKIKASEEQVLHKDVQHLKIPPLFYKR